MQENPTRLIVNQENCGGPHPRDLYRYRTACTITATTGSRTEPRSGPHGSRKCQAFIPTCIVCLAMVIIGDASWIGRQTEVNRIGVHWLGSGDRVMDVAEVDSYEESFFGDCYHDRTRNDPNMVAEPGYAPREKTVGARQDNSSLISTAPRLKKTAAILTPSRIQNPGYQKKRSGWLGPRWTP